MCDGFLDERREPPRPLMRVKTVLEAYRNHVAERAAQGIVPQPLNAEQTAGLVELLKNPPAGEEAFLVDLITNRVPAGVDEAAYVKAGFLSALPEVLQTIPLSVKQVGHRSIRRFQVQQTA